jgi:hypothetical protein
MIGTRLQEQWMSHGLKTNPGVSSEDLAAFESKYQVSMPTDLREYFLTVNGMSEGTRDDALIRFWALNEVKPIPEGAPDYSDIEDAESLFLFADYCIWSHAYAIRLSSNRETSNGVFVVGDENPVQIFESFSELVREYLLNPDHLLTNIIESFKS